MDYRLGNLLVDGKNVVGCRVNRTAAYDGVIKSVYIEEEPGRTYPWFTVEIITTDGNKRVVKNDELNDHNVSVVDANAI